MVATTCKHMVFDVYGNFMEGLEEDGCGKNLAFPGTDFVQPRKSKSPIPFGDGIGDSFKSSL